MPNTAAISPPPKAVAAFGYLLGALGGSAAVLAFRQAYRISSPLGRSLLLMITATVLLMACQVALQITKR